MDELKLIFASHLIKLRTGAGLTQAELGAKLNYSDKTVSKWERGEAIPDAYVLKQISALFHVTVDDLLSANDQWQAPALEPEQPTFSKASVIQVSIAGIWTLAILIFVVFWILGSLEWLIFAAAVLVSLISLLVFNCIWNRRKGNVYIVAALVFCIIGIIYLLLLHYNPWQLFLVVIPAEVVVWLSYRIKKGV